MIHPRAILLVCGIAALGGPLLPAPPASPYLRIGDPAPTLASATPISGKPGAFKKGQLYAVEFWATWCGPCKDSIPHVTEMAKTYKGKVSFVGVDIWENGKGVSAAGLAKAKAFVKEQGARMGYTVVADGPEGRIAETWMKPAGESGIPCAFLVDRQGRVAWIGHPAKLEDVLKEEVAGTYNLEAARDRRETEMELSRPIEAALAAKRYPEAVKVIETAMAKRPEWKHNLAYKYLLALFHADLDRAVKESRRILEESNQELGAYNMIMAIIAVETDLAPEAYGFGKVLAAEVEKRGIDHYLFLAMAADINFNAGDIPTSISLGERALAAAQKDAGTKPETLTLITSRLADHKAAFQKIK